MHKGLPSKTENKQEVAKIFPLKSSRNLQQTQLQYYPLTVNNTDTDQVSSPLFPRSMYPEFRGFLLHLQIRSSVFVGSECFVSLTTWYVTHGQGEGSKRRILESLHNVSAVQTWWISSFFFFLSRILLCLKNSHGYKFRQV